VTCRRNSATGTQSFGCPAEAAIPSTATRKIQHAIDKALIADCKPLGRDTHVAGVDLHRSWTAGKQYKGGETLDQLVVSGGDAA
jgi:hypothetical protein